MASIGEVRERRNAETELVITKVHLEVVTGEPRETETLIRGSGRGCWKSTRKGNSLAAYSMTSKVLKASGGGDPFAEPNQDHRAIKRLTRPMLGFNVVHSASITLQGIELMHMIKKDQMISADGRDLSAAEKFYYLASQSLGQSSHAALEGN